MADQETERHRDAAGDDELDKRIPLQIPQGKSNQDQYRRMEDIDGKVVHRHELFKISLPIKALSEEDYESKAYAHAEERFPEGIGCALPVKSSRVTW